MNAQPDAVCPCCSDQNLERIGKLPDSQFFAGKRLSKPLPGGNLYRCRHCHLKFRHPAHDSAVYDQLYDNATISTWPSDSFRPDWDLIIRQVVEQLPQGGRVLDFGCYTGGLLALLDSASYERHGIEINRAAAIEASKNADSPIWSAVENIPPDLRFDVVIAADVIEHMPNPLDFIDRLTSLLTDHGILIITTGDADNSLWNRFGANWWYCFYPEHVAFLSKTWLSYLSQVRRLSIIHTEIFRYCRPPPIRRFFDTIFTYCYGWFPACWLLLGDLLKKMRRRPFVTSVPGNGVSADHLLIVLTRKVAP